MLEIKKHNVGALISIQPYWVFLIIANTMGWDIGKIKTIEVRKSYPKNKNWNKVAKIYCSKNKASFAKIPKEYQPLMERFLGKVIGEFICDEITYLGNVSTDPWCALIGDVHEWHKQLVTKYACLTEEELLKYGGKYAWRISNLVIYDKPRELSEFYIDSCINFRTGECVSPTNECVYLFHNSQGDIQPCITKLKRPPQSWCYVKEVI